MFFLIWYVFALVCIFSFVVLSGRTGLSVTGLLAASRLVMRSSCGSMGILNEGSGLVWAYVRPVSVSSLFTLPAKRILFSS